MPCSSPSEETNFYMTRINPAGKLQCCPDALGSCDYNEILGTDSKREGLSAGFVTVQILSLAHMPGTCLESLCPDGERGLCPTLAQASCRLGPVAARERLALKEWPVAGSEGGEEGPALPLDDGHLLASLPAASVLPDNPFSPQGPK